MWKNIVEPDRPQITIWRMRIACWISKATDSHSEYVTLMEFPTSTMVSPKHLNSVTQFHILFINQNTSKAYRESKGTAPLICKLCTIGGDGQHHAPATLPKGKNPGTHWTGGWVNFREGLDGMEKRQISAPDGTENPDQSARSLVTTLSYTGSVYML